VGKGTQPGTIASLQIIGMPDENSAVVKKLPITTQQTRVPLVVNVFNEPTEGKCGYKLVLPTGPIAGLNISLAEVRAEARGLTLNYGYDDPIPDITKTVELSCPNFRR
jgi:hypothetical protein